MRSLLDGLHAHGVPCALVSNSPRSLVDAVLGSLGADAARWFATTVAGDGVVHTKPDPETYLTAAARLGTDPRSCVVLEDSPTAVAAGEAAGCVVVAVPSLRQINAAPGRTVLASLAELDVADLPRLVRGRAA